MHEKHALKDSTISANYLPGIVGSFVPLSKDRHPQSFQGLQKEFVYARLAFSLVRRQFTPHNTAGHGLNPCGRPFASGGARRESWSWLCRERQRSQASQSLSPMSGVHPRNHCQNYWSKMRCRSSLFLPPRRPDASHSQCLAAVFCAESYVGFSHLTCQPRLVWTVSAYSAA